MAFTLLTGLAAAAGGTLATGTALGTTIGAASTTAAGVAIPGFVTSTATAGGSLAGLSTGIGSALSIAGPVSQAYGALAQQGASREQEAIRRKQAQMEANRERRRIIREAAIRRGQAINIQAASAGEINPMSSIGTAIEAGTTQFGANRVADVNVNENLGMRMFDAQAAESRARGFTSAGQGIQNFGNTILNNNVTLAKLFQNQTETLFPAKG